MGSLCSQKFSLLLPILLYGDVFLCLFYRCPTGGKGLVSGGVAELVNAEAAFRLSRWEGGVPATRHRGSLVEIRLRIAVTIGVRIRVRFDWRCCEDWGMGRPQLGQG